ncbi:glycosyltransferase family 2 protein [Lacticaseibacillus hegangensis]|uniref:Glycosyltransferase family 2 protein n=1 Tax=Lacticaseibacillus hegangensis TaxID=2486010 RepID=A0ABW4CWI8_9LACO|nr:glycosyltransferase family 2 protein [Lacticaseibacillus hegangensis]
MSSVTVLLSTYNGDAYLRELLDSLLNQTSVEVHIRVRDDGSTDHTRSILTTYAKKDNVKVAFGKNIGWRDSFMTLIKSVPNDDSSDYFAFADQDDIYQPDKLEAAITKLSAFPKTPALYHSNVTLADSEGRPLGDRYPRDYVPTTKLPQAFFDVTWLGTTMVFNRRLLTLVQQHVPVDNIVHDAYVINVAQFLGKVIYDPVPHMLYRRHNSAVTGFGGSGSARKIQSPSLMDRYRRYKKNPVTNPFSKRARELLVGYSQQLDPKQRNFLSAVANYQTNLGYRLRLLFDPRIRASSLRPTLQIRYRVLMNSL